MSIYLIDAVFLDALRERHYSARQTTYTVKEKSKSVCERSCNENKQMKMEGWLSRTKI